MTISYTRNYKNNDFSEIRVDSSNLLWFANELTNFDLTMYETLRAQLSLFKAVSVYKTEPYQTIYNYKMFTDVGKAETGSVVSGFITDIPVSDVEGEDFNSPIVDVYSKIIFTPQDIMLSSTTGRDAIAMKGENSFRINLQEMNRNGIYGNKKFGVPGILSNKNIPTSVMANDWKNQATITGEILYKNLLAIVASIGTATGQLIAPNICLMAPALYSIIDTTIYNIYQFKSVKSAFEETTKIQIICAHELAGSEIKRWGNIPNAKDSLIMFNDASSYIKHIVSTMFEMQPIEKNQLLYESIGLSRHGGVIITQPKACHIASNLN